MVQQNEAEGKLSPQDIDESSYRENREVISEEEETEGAQTVVYHCPINHSGTTVYVKGWVWTDSPFPPVILIHDLGENTRFYRTFSQIMSEYHFNVYCYDLRGHGRSGQIIGHIPSFDSLVRDLLQVVSWVRFKSERRIPILISQGVGGLISTYFQEQFPECVKYAVSIAPVLKETQGLSLASRAFIRTMAEMAPRTRIPKSMVSRFLALGGTPPSKRQLSFPGMTFNFAKEVMNAVKHLPSVFTRAAIDSMVIVPQQVTTYDAVFLKTLVAEHPLKDKIRLVEIGNIGAHPLTHKSQVRVVLESIFPWLEEKLGITIVRGQGYGPDSE